MKKSFVFPLLLVSAFASAEAIAQKNKIPHSHHSAVGGEVIMLGDDHVEIKTSKKKTVLEVYFSDKFRNPVPASAFNFQIGLKEGENLTPLSFKASAKDPSMGFVEIPNGIDPAKVEIEVRAPRIEKPKGYVSTDGAARVSLSKILKVGKTSPSSNMEGMSH